MKGRLRELTAALFREKWCDVHSDLLKLARSLALVAVFFICGGQWVALQTMAWGRMLIDYSQQSTIALAIAKTFDGTHPCPMCKAVENGSGKQKQPAAQNSLAKLVLIHSPVERFIFFAPFGSRFLISDSLASSRADEPPSPPPRIVLG